MEDRSNDAQIMPIYYSSLGVNSSQDCWLDLQFCEVFEPLMTVSANMSSFSCKFFSHEKFCSCSNNSSEELLFYYKCSSLQNLILGLLFLTLCPLLCKSSGLSHLMFAGGH